MTKVFGPLLIVLSSVKNFNEHSMRLGKTIWQLIWKIKERFFKNQEVVENAKLWKTRQTFQLREYFGLFFLVSSYMKKDKEHIKKVHKVFWHWLGKG